jgi:hypothetical protein
MGSAPPESAGYTAILLLSMLSMYKDDRHCTTPTEKKALEATEPPSSTTTLGPITSITGRIYWLDGTPGIDGIDVELMEFITKTVH